MREPRENGEVGLMLAAFRSRNERLAHAVDAGARCLRETVLGAVGDWSIRPGARQGSPLPLLAEGGILNCLLSTSLALFMFDSVTKCLLRVHSLRVASRRLTPLIEATRIALGLQLDGHNPQHIADPSAGPSSGTPASARTQLARVLLPAHVALMWEQQSLVKESRFLEGVHNCDPFSWWQAPPLLFSFGVKDNLPHRGTITFALSQR